jgi:hypothetical protein
MYPIRSRHRSSKPWPGSWRRAWLGGKRLVAFAVLAAAAPRLAADSVGVEPVQPDPARLRPAVVFASIERAWMIGNADSVVEHVGKRKVLISLPDGGPDPGSYSRAQSYFIFKEMFDATRTEGFSFVSIREAEDAQQSAVGRAERTFRLRDSSRLQTDRIFVSLVHEQDRWVIAEIKSIR